ncbi:hypothetical protein A4X13_0g2700 [Tilletia indica]|uniref:DNA mismatch repair protein n=1 Tax=Tilletia indica TaxID=43049 RepID=A0A177TLC4_9BASI|nr:hypothetical protein A4X13_0g2700 [Tilletia indica]
MEMRTVAAVARRVCRPPLIWTGSRSAHALAEGSDSAGGRLAVAPAPSKRPKAKGRVRQVKLFEDLPSQRLDSNGEKAAPLPEWMADQEAVKPATTAKRTVRRKKKAEVDPEEERTISSDGPLDGPEVPLLHELGAEGQAWPPLAKEVLINMARFPGCILLTRVGGFYESYFSQAPELAALLSIKLASRTWGGRTVGMAGFPLSQLEKYLKVLVQDCGKLVAICEEFREFAHSGTSVEDHLKGDEDDTKIRRSFNEGVTIKRRITRVVTPGTLIDEKFLDPFSNNFILSVSSLPTISSSDGPGSHPAPPIYGLAWLDVSTADFNTTICTDAISLRDEVARISPREIILQAGSFNDDTSNSSSQIQESSSTAATEHPLWEALDAKSVMVTYTNGDMTKQDSLVGSAQFNLNLSGMTPAENKAVSYLTSYLQDRLLNMASSALSNSTPLRRDRSQVMHIDAHTMSALEIKESIREGGVRGSLASIVRRTLTRGGTRLLGEWLTSPSTNLETIKSRQTLVELFLNNAFLRDDLRLLLRRGAGDVSRVLQKIVTARNDEQDLLEVRDFIGTCDAIVARLKAEQKSIPLAAKEPASLDSEQPSEEFALQRLADSFQALTTLGSELADAIDAGVIEKRLRAQEEMVRRMENEAAGKEGFYTENDQNTQDKASLRKTKKDSGGSSDESDGLWGQPLEHLIRPSSSPALQALTKEHTSLRKQAKKLELVLKEHFTERVTLKFLLGQGFVVHFPDFKDKFNEIIEEHMTPAQRNKTTRTFYHRQWSVIGNRLQRLSDQLREKEYLELERLRQNVMLALSALRHNARLVDQLDVLLSFSQLAQELNLIRPIVDESRDLDIRAGRHLSVEVGLLESQAAKASAEEARLLIDKQTNPTKVTSPPPALQQRSFVANNLQMRAETDTLHLITGPNMGGKSTFLRQNALMAILAQCGSFVPASYARIGIVDRIFSRVGAKDDLFRDRSTFMVEMLETAEILSRATSRSLVIADEIGRGTTSEVGLAVAYATVHQLYEIGCRALFASHFHEVADMLSYSEAVDGPGGSGRVDGDRFAKIRFFCTDVDENSSGSISYSHRLRPGINRDSHGLKVARIAGMPPRAVHVAEAALRWIQGPSGWSRVAPEQHLHDRLELLDQVTDK